MLNYEKLSRKPSIFRSFTGLEVPEFDALYMKIHAKYAAYEEKRLYREDRQRGVGTGHPFKLALKERLLMLLMYHRFTSLHLSWAASSTWASPTSSRTCAASNPL